jgi:hypothetical protein
MKASACIALIGFSCLVGAASAMAGPVSFVVVESRGIALRPGATIDGSQPITLAEGQQLVLISQAGKTLKLRGPYNEAPAAGDEGATTDVAGALKSLVAQIKTRNDKVGLIRGAAPAAIPPEPWLLDVTHSGNRCVREGAPIKLWRPGGRVEATLSIMPYDRSWLIRADWPAGSDALTAPKTVPFVDHASYVFRLDDHQSAITIMIIPTAVDNDAMRLGWMMDRGCDAQAQALIKGVASTE